MKATCEHIRISTGLHPYCLACGIDVGLWLEEHCLDQDGWIDDLCERYSLAVYDIGDYYRDVTGERL